MIQYSQIMRKCKNTPHLVHHLYVLCYHQIQKYPIRMRTTDIYKQHDLYSRACAYVSPMLKWFHFTVSCAPVACIRSLRMIISIASAKIFIIFVLGISNTFQNSILANPEEQVYPILPHIYL